MDKVAAQFYHWLMSHNIDPDKVKLVIEADDIILRERVKDHIKADMHPMVFDPTLFANDLRGLKLHGIGVSFR